LYRHEIRSVLQTCAPGSFKQSFSEHGYRNHHCPFGSHRQLLALFFTNTNELLNSWKKGIRALVYLNPDADDAKRLDLK